MLFVSVVLAPLTFHLAKFHPVQIRLFDFMRNYVSPVFYPVFHLIFYVWIFLYAALRCWEEGLRTIEDAVRAVRDKRVLDVELLLVVMMLGELPALLLEIPGGSAWYFCAIAPTLAFGLFAARLPFFLAKIRRRRSFSENLAGMEIVDGGRALVERDVLLVRRVQRRRSVFSVHRRQYSFPRRYFDRGRFGKRLCRERISGFDDNAHLRAGPAPCRAVALQYCFVAVALG